MLPNPKDGWSRCFGKPGPLVGAFEPRWFHAKQADIATKNKIIQIIAGSVSELALIGQTSSQKGTRESVLD